MSTREQNERVFQRKEARGNVGCKNQPPRKTLHAPNSPGFSRKNIMGLHMDCSHSVFPDACPDSSANLLCDWGQIM